MNHAIPRVFAVVVTYNGEPWIEGCLRSLLVSSLVPSVIVVDNSSSDQTISICARFPQVRVLRSATNVGFGRANNLGIALALKQGATAVLLLNQDARMQPGALQRLVEVQAGHPSAGVLGPVQWDDSGNQLDATFARHYLSGCLPHLLADALQGQVKPTYSVDSLPAAAWFVSATCLHEVGGFDPLFFMYCEDDDFCQRARAKGFEILLATGAHFNHVRGFYGPAAAKPAPPSFSKQVRRARSNVVLSLKDPSRGIAMSLANTVCCSLAGATQALLVSRNPRRAAAQVTALVRTVLFELLTIHRHRQRSARPGPAWLDSTPHSVSAPPAA